jgi:serine/threonine protein kinase
MADDRMATHEGWLASDVLRALHSVGWRHADLQGAHILLPDEGGVHLIDFALAQGPAGMEIKPQIPYRGALAHLTAPEVAAEILQTIDSKHITLTFEAEVYTFGAILFAAWTRQWPCEYGKDSRELTLTDIYAVIADPVSRRPAPGGWPRMAGLIGAMLESDPAKRPTIHEVHSDLSEMTGART